MGRDNFDEVMSTMIAVRLFKPEQACADDGARRRQINNQGTRREANGIEGSRSDSRANFDQRVGCWCEVGCAKHYGLGWRWDYPPISEKRADFGNVDVKGTADLTRPYLAIPKDSPSSRIYIAATVDFEAAIVCLCRWAHGRDVMREARPGELLGDWARNKRPFWRIPFSMCEPMNTFPAETLFLHVAKCDRWMKGESDERRRSEARTDPEPARDGKQFRLF
jgi:hypothetical protein